MVEIKYMMQLTQKKEVLMMLKCLKSLNFLINGKK